MNKCSIPEGLAPVVLTSPVTTNGGVTCDYISLKNVHMVWIVAVFTQAAGHTTGIDPVQATAVDGTGAKAITNALPIWTNTDVSATSVLDRQADAITANCSSSVANQVIVMQVDPAGLDVDGGFDVLGVTVDDSASATNFVSVVAYIEPRYTPAPDVIA